MTYPHIHISLYIQIWVWRYPRLIRISAYPIDIHSISKTYPHIHISRHIQTRGRYPKFIHISIFPMDIHLDISWIHGYMDIHLDISWISHGYLMDISLDIFFWISIPVFWICKPQEKKRYPYIHISMTYPWLIHDLSTYPYISVHIQCDQVPRCKYVLGLSWNSLAWYII